jgi:hypothetical protein
MLQGIVVEIHSKVFILTEIRVVSTEKIYLCTAVLISPYPVQEGNKLGSMSGTRAISTKSRGELSSIPSPPPPQGKGPMEIHAILTEILACFLPDRAKDLSAPL